MPRYQRQETARRKKRRLCSWSLIMILKDIVLLIVALPALTAFFNHAKYSHGGHDAHGHGGHAHGNHSAHPAGHLGQHSDHSAAATPPLPHARSCDCGHSVAEALTLGCKYDSLAAAWLPAHCRDDELTAEFEQAGDGPNGSWTYWADTKHTQVVGLDEIAAMADDPARRFHMSSHWHVVHCIFYWRKEHRARFNGKMVEPRSDNEKHIKHCGKIFLNPTYGTVAGVALNTDHSAH